MSSEVAVQPKKELQMVDEGMLKALGMTMEQLAATTGVLGMEDSRPEDFQIPRLQISQALSPQILRSKPEYIPGLQVGQYFNTVTSEVYGDSIRVLAIKNTVSRLRFQGGVLECQSKNGVDGGHHAPTCKLCPLKEWGTGIEGRGTDCKEYRNWLLMDEGLGMPMSFSFKSASLIVAKNWRTQLEARMMLLPNGVKIHAPAYATIYEMKTGEKQGPKGTYYVPIVHIVGPASNAQMEAGRKVSESFKGELVSEVGGDE